MKRPTAVVFVVLTVALLALVWVERTGHRTPGAAPSATSAQASAPRAPEADPPAATKPDSDSVTELGAEPDDNADAGGSLVDGGVVPELETVAPKSIVFGVILIQYAGAQGAAPGTRSRAEADKLAGELAELAARDFKAAVERGDPGSTTNAGRMFRGVLEPAPEFVLFSLGKGDVSAPVDTPRGLWIARRVE